MLLKQGRIELCVSISYILAGSFRFQIQGGGVNEPNPYTSYSDCVRRMVRTEGSVYLITQSRFKCSVVF